MGNWGFSGTDSAIRNISRTGLGRGNGWTPKVRRPATAGPGMEGPRAAGRGGVMRRVVISGVGVVAPNGVGREAFWQGCVNGHSGIGPIRSFDASHHPIRVAGEVHDFDPEPYIPDKFRKSVKVMGRA